MWPNPNEWKTDDAKNNVRYESRRRQVCTAWHGIAYVLIDSGVQREDYQMEALSTSPCLRRVPITRANTSYTAEQEPNIPIERNMRFQMVNWEPHMPQTDRLMTGNPTASKSRSGIGENCSQGYKVSDDNA